MSYIGSALINSVGVLTFCTPMVHSNSSSLSAQPNASVWLSVQGILGLADNVVDAHARSLLGGTNIYASRAIYTTALLGVPMVLLWRCHSMLACVDRNWSLETLRNSYTVRVK